MSLKILNNKENKIIFIRFSYLSKLKQNKKEEEEEIYKILDI
jgi:hypothetical protein